MIGEEQVAAGRIKISEDFLPKTMYPHQVEALDAMRNITESEGKYRGLLVLPTGGGKTFTAVYWALNQVINKGKKVLWLAHRHELLNQTYRTLKETAFRDVVPDRESFSYRIISGMHQRAVNMVATDDFIIASKDSLRSNNEYLEAWIEANKNKICVIVDEAHHAVAPSYLKLIQMVERKSVEWFKLLGLTATPIRTSEGEAHLLSKLFKDGIVYSVNLTSLIECGNLARPILKDVTTPIVIKDELTKKDLRYIRQFGELPQSLAETIARHAQRNQRIVQAYMEEREKYGKCLVFAININHAIALNAVFQARGVKSDFVVSDVHDMYSGVCISKEENEAKINAFRKGDLEVLINVNILTEGTDIPDVQTVFLTRPTCSTILLNQMIGRGLRGVKSGGTSVAYIVSFIDDWRADIAWVTPKMILAEGDFIEETHTPYRPLKYTLIPIKLIEEFAKLMDGTVAEKCLQMSYLERVPVGCYVFKLLEEDDEGEEYTEYRKCEVLIFKHLQVAYEQFVENLEYIEKKYIRSKGYVRWTRRLLEKAYSEIKETYFEGYLTDIGLNQQDIEDILLYYHTTGKKPEWREFKEREEYDITYLANQIVQENMTCTKQLAYLQEAWKEEKWQTYFKEDFYRFKDEVRREAERMLLAEQVVKPEVITEEVDYKKCSLSELYEIDLSYYRKIVDAVYGAARDEEGYYHSAISDYKSKNRRYFEIDHIIPISKGGLTELNNLQLLTRWENRMKGNKMPEESIEELEEHLKSTRLLNHAEESMEVLERLREKAPNNIEVLLMGAQIKLEEEKYRSALIWVNKALKEDGQNIKGLALKGEIYYEQGKLEQAVEFLEAAYERGNEDIEMFLMLGNCYYDLKEKDKALYYYFKGLEVDEENTELLFHIAYTYDVKRQYEKAIEYYSRVITLDKQDANAWNNRGYTYEKMKQYDQALANYEMALKLNPENRLYQENRRCVLEKM